MTAVLVYYFIFLIAGAIIALGLFRIFDTAIHLLIQLIKSITSWH